MTYYFFKFFIFILFNFTILYWFCHISKWICHRYTCVPHPEPSSLPIPSLWVVPVHQPQASSIVHQTWTGDSFHIWYYTYFNAILPHHPTLSLSHRVQKTVLYIILFFNFTILYWFCHISTWIRHRYTRVPHPEPSSLLPPRTLFKRISFTHCRQCGSFFL